MLVKRIISVQTVQADGHEELNLIATKINRDTLSAIRDADDLSYSLKTDLGTCSTTLTVFKEDHLYKN